ncbi:MAG: thiamine pyrophosphate-dependent dehydrogenase E1 component subunit alpha [Bdellovibrionales bacterium]|nr:thiamine pyrophosphate-dependent dehydrogenase E1 component subunit alpha [Bdellovibrionales bacterium]
MKYGYKGKAFADTKTTLGKETLTDLFYSMLRIRRIEEGVEAHYHEDEMKTPIHLVIGQEASCVGACAPLSKEDLVYASHRTHGVYLAKGGDLKAMLSEFFCRKNGCAGSRGGSMHLIDQSVGMAGSSAICGGNVPIAVGLALAAKLQGVKRVNMCTFGDGAAEEGVVWEAINFAALKKLPVVFFCENNFFSVFTPLYKRQPENVELWKKAEAFGATSRVVDGSNVVEVYEAVAKAREGALSGDGPYFVESRVYRWRGHGGAGDDNSKGYRDPAELVDWKKVCPIESYFNFLKSNHLLSDADRAEMEEEIAREFEEAYDFARNSPEPDESDLATHVYSERIQYEVNKDAVGRSTH